MAFYVVQFLTGLASAASLFLVASGLSIIFGVTRIVNFAHGAFYMLGAYVAFTLTERFSGALGFWGGVVVAALIVAAVGVLVEMVLLRRIYHAPELFQLLATFGLTLMVQDIVVLIWGPDDLLGPPCAGFQRRGRFLRPERPELRSVPDRAQPGRARRALAVVPAHALGRAGARGDAGPRHGGSPRRQPEMAVHQRVCARRLSGSPRRRAADPARRRAPRARSAHHRRRLRRGRDRRARQHHRRVRRRRAGVGTERLRYSHFSEDLHHPGVPGDGGGADRAAMGPVRQARGRRAPHPGADRQSLAAAHVRGTLAGAGRACDSGDAAAVRRQLRADRRLGDRDLRDLRRQPAFPDVGRRPRVVRPRRLFRARCLWRRVPRQDGGIADDRLAAPGPAAGPAWCCGVRLLRRAIVRRLFRDADAWRSRRSCGRSPSSGSR